MPTTKTTSKPWTIEYQNEDGTWTKLARARAWRYKTEANALKDLGSKWMRRFLQGATARPVLIDGCAEEVQ